jgi:hypothetical protein
LERHDAFYKEITDGKVHNLDMEYSPFLLIILSRLLHVNFKIYDQRNNMLIINYQGEKDTTQEVKIKLTFDSALDPKIHLGDEIINIHEDYIEISGIYNEMMTSSHL